MLAGVSGRLVGTGPPNLFLTVGRHRRLFRAWIRFAGRLMPGGLLPRRETELVILRVGHLRRCRYELDHHTRLAGRAGLSPADLDRVAAGPSVPGWSGRERAVLTAVDALHDSQDVDDQTWDALRVHLDEREVLELCFLVGHYEMLATVIAAVRLQPDTGRRRPTALIPLRRARRSDP